MAINDKKTPTSVPITVLPPGSGNQIDRVREWTRAEEKPRALWITKPARWAIDDLPRIVPRLVQKRTPGRGGHTPRRLARPLEGRHHRDAGGGHGHVENCFWSLTERPTTQGLRKRQPLHSMLKRRTRTER